MFLQSLVIPFLLATGVLGGPPKGGARPTPKELLKTGNLTFAQLTQVWDRLPASSAKEIIGTYKGTNLTPELSGIDKIGWYGKRFVNATSVDPLLGTKVGADGKPVIYTYPRANIAQLREIRHRGKTVASIVYDNSPIMDYFAKVDKDTFLGIGDQKGMGYGPIFLLERAPKDLVVVNV